MHTRTLVSLIVTSVGISPAAAAIVDHDDVDAVASLSQSTMDAVGQQKWFFTHASVGGNMTQGMTDLHTANPTRYQLVIASVGYNSSLQRANDPPVPTLSGRVYECNRSNPGWQAKINIFVNSVNQAGWHDPAVTVAMDKFCYIDQAASASTCLTAMANLEAAYPRTIFVYTTMPLMTSEDANNILRNQYNAAVRAFCSANSRLLFDIADIEAHDPAGNAYTFTSGGQVYQKLYSGYTSDGGHLNATGRQRVATGWYAVAAVIAGFKAGDFDGDGRVSENDCTIFHACSAGPFIAHPASTACTFADFERDLDVDADDFGIFQRCYTGLLPVDPSCVD